METYSDDRILTQPIGYWASMTGRSAVTFIRATLEQHGLTQPQWWALNYIAARPDGVELDEVVEFHRGFVDTDDALRPDIAALVATGLLTEVDGALTVSPAGQRRRDETWPDIRAALARIRAGVTDDEFITTIRTLQRMIDNIGDAAWHA
ncbi:MarR family transcriptional regulator [Tsukamurella asaccharolytica]|uniref:MarR family transcriptional regulator n=1 Tax=Tsukamurella asaccharolytica TaxID=2592067 RepID=A0A5C5R6K8_9ACTN|nr:MarR family transcriptional regulator [Tsukamurella asaccharolytica]TWS18302.1 MarR family transcriptional regulator [Tsukamurella asaccharolytica]